MTKQCHDMTGLASNMSNYVIVVARRLWLVYTFDKKVQVGKDQEKAQSEKDSQPKNRGGKKPNQQSGTYTIKTFRKPNEQLFSQ